MTTQIPFLIAVHAGHRGGGFMFAPLAGVLVLLAALLGVWLLARNHRWIRLGSRPEDTAMATLQERFARGEIDADEYLARAAVLRPAKGKQPPAPESKTTKEA